MTKRVADMSPEERERHRAAAKAWHEANKERKRAANKAWHEANKERHRAAAKAWREANKERKRAANEAWHEANKERKRAANKAWREANKERKRAANKAWHEANPEKCRAISHKRRARKLQAEPKWLGTPERQWMAKVFEIATLLGVHVDHIVPLQGKTVCGLHVPWNLRPLAPGENISKGNRYVPLSENEEAHLAEFHALVCAP